MTQCDGGKNQGMNRKGNIVGLYCNLGIGSVSFLVVLLNGLAPKECCVIGCITSKSYDIENYKVGRESDRRPSFKIWNYLGVKRHTVVVVVVVVKKNIQNQETKVVYQYIIRTANPSRKITHSWSLRSPVEYGTHYYSLLYSPPCHKINIPESCTDTLIGRSQHWIFWSC